MQHQLVFLLLLGFLTATSSAQHFSVLKNNKITGDDFETKFQLQSNFSIPGATIRHILPHEDFVVAFVQESSAPSSPLTLYKVSTLDDGTMKLQTKFSFPPIISFGVVASSSGSFSDSFYLLYRYQAAPAPLYVAEMNPYDLSIIRNNSFLAKFTPGEGIICESLKTIYFPHDQIPNQLKEISLISYVELGTINLDKYGTMLHKMMHPSKPLMYLLFSNKDSSGSVALWNVVEYDIPNVNVTRTFTSNDLTMLPISATIFTTAGEGLLKIAITLNDNIAERYGLALFDVEQFQLDDAPVVLEHPSPAYPVQYTNLVTSSKDYLYFIAARRYLPNYLYLWRVPSASLASSSLQYVNVTSLAPMPIPSLIFDLVANDHGSYFQIAGVADKFFKTN